MRRAKQSSLGPKKAHWRRGETKTVTCGRERKKVEQQKGKNRPNHFSDPTLVAFPP